MSDWAVVGMASTRSAVSMREGRLDAEAKHCHPLKAIVVIPSVARNLVPNTQQLAVRRSEESR